MRHPIATVVATVTMLALAACTGGPEGDQRGSTQPPGGPQVTWHDCDPTIEETLWSKHRCGTLTVPQDRRHPDGPTLDLTVVQVWPVGVDPKPGLGTGFNDNIGDPKAFDGNMITGATRQRKVGVGLGFRGTSPSTPTLECPELDALDAEAPALPDDDPGLRARFLGGVAACAERLREDGVEPSNFDSAAAAADVEDLRRAMGVETWWVGGSYGTQSRVLFRYLHDFPGRLEAAYLDSPWFPDSDDLTGGALGTRSALAELFSACADNARCARLYPHLQSAWNQSLVRTARTPLTGPGWDADLHKVRVLVDDAKLLRFVRYAFGGDGTENLTWLPQTISDAAAGRLNPHLADLVARDPLFCAGYRPECATSLSSEGERPGFAWGVYLTSLCKEQLPGFDPGALRTALKGQPAYRQVFARSPYLQACDAWNTPGDQAPPPPDPHGASLLLLPGQFDSYSRPEWSQDHAATWDRAWTFIAPNNTHNTLGYDECGLAVRNAWVTAPTMPPDPKLCSTPPRLRFE